MTTSFYIVVFAFITQLSATERHSAAVAEPPASQADRADTHAPDVGAPLIQKTIDGLSSLGDAVTSVQKPGAALDHKRGEPPATFVWARISKRYLANQVERAVDRTKPVRDYILGTTIRGESHTTGKTHFVLYPNDDQALGEVEFVGEVHGKTVGHNGPATLQYLSDSTFRAHKRITIDESGLRASPATANAPTRLTATAIRTSLPGLRGRIAQRIAWRRVASSQREADAIASDHTADDIRGGLDRRINESVAAIQTKLQSQIADLKLDDDKKPMVVKSRSTPEYIEVAFCRPGVSPDELRMHSVAIEGDPDITVRAHRTVLARVLSDSKLRERFAPILGSSILASTGPPNVLAKSDQPRGKSSNVAMDGEWLVIAFTAGEREEPSPRVALEGPELGQRVR
jgi:hypothetical protein